MTLYETPEDRRAQEAVLKVYCGLARTYEQMPETCVYDGKIFDATVLVELAEVKCRKNPVGQYPTLTIDVAKVDVIVDLAQRLRVVPVLLVSWTDALRRIVLRAGWDTDNQTRQREGEQPDLVYHIPVGEFADLW
jgi:hypothetical protein